MKIPHLRLAPLTLLFTLCSSLLTLQAQSLATCQQLAEQNYPLIRKYDLVEQTTQYTVQNLNRGWLPQLTLSAQATLQSDVVSLPDALTGMMTAQGLNVKGLKKDQYKVQLELQQVLYDGGAISSQREVARRQGEVEAASNDVDMYQLRSRINDLYFGFLLTQERLAINDASLHLLNNNIARLQALLDEGVAMQSDLSTLRAELLTAEQRTTELRTTLDALQQMLSLFCGREVTPEPITETKLTNTPGNNFDLRPEMQLLDSRSSLLAAQRKALDAKLMPKVSLFAQGFYGYPGLNMYEDMFSHDWSLNGIVGLRMQWNISSFYTRSGDLHKLRLQQEQLQTARDLFNFNATLQQTQEQRNAERCQKLLQQDDEIIRLRQSVREASEAKLQDGIIDSYALVEQITREEAARISRLQHLIEFAQRQANLQFLRNETIRE